jgi:hypothetical protein
MTTLTKNTDKLRQEVATHVAADSIVQGDYWDEENRHGCYIGCLAKGDDPTINEVTYGLPVILQRIAEGIFETLPADEAKAFFAALPDAIACDGKDLTKVSWQFLAAELRSLPEQLAEIQAFIDPVIAGMDLLASGQEWTAAAAAGRDAAARAADDAWAAVWATADDAARAAVWAARAAVWAADAARAAVWAARAAVWAANAAAAAWAANTATTRAGSRRRQRDLLLRLISEAPVVKNHQ